MTASAPLKHLGQHFLVDEAQIEAIIAAVGPSDVIVEIGPGRGALTRSLATCAKHLYAIEKDSALAEALQQQFAETPQVTIRCADALQEDLKTYPRGLRLVGNLPYNIATVLLRRWMDVRTHVCDFTLMVQREVAQRLVAPPGDSARGQLSVVTQLLMEADILFDVPPECFDPPPKVMSSVVRLRPRQELPIPEDAWRGLERLVQQAFAARRKTLKNNFPDVEKATWTTAGIDPGRRAETLSVAEFVQFYKVLSSEL